MRHVPMPQVWCTDDGSQASSSHVLSVRHRIRLGGGSGGSKSLEERLVAAPVGVDGGARVEAPATHVICEPTAGLFDDERWGGVVPQVACKPDTSGDLAFGDAALVPRPFVGPSADDTFESLLLVRRE